MNNEEEYGGAAGKESYEEVQKFLEDPKYIHYVGLLSPPRPGVGLCAVKLEYKYFIPGTPRNDDFFLRIFKWNETVWLMISIPKDEAHPMAKVAAECGLRIANGIPTMIGGASEPFPASGENVFTLENVPGHPVYANDPEGFQRLMQSEEKEVNAILKKWSSRN